MQTFHRSLRRHSAAGSVICQVERVETRRMLANIVVTSLGDAVVTDSVTSLREAVIQANAATTPTTITFSPTVFSGPRTIKLAGTQLAFTNTKAATTIQGPATGLTIDADNHSRHIFINGGVTLNLSKLTLTNGVALGSTFYSERGGSIENNGGVLSVRDSTFIANRARLFGGALNQDNFASATLINVTLNGNSITAATGAGGAISTYGRVDLKNVTVSGNSAPQAGGINVNNNSGRPFSVANTIVAGNSTTIAGTGDAVGNFTSLGYNLIGKTDKSSGWVGSDKKGTVAAPLNAKLGVLANNGGPTKTLLPLTGSPAIDGGLNSNVPAGISTDQRGAARITNGHVDVGAVETPAPPFAVLDSATKVLTVTGTSGNDFIRASVSANVLTVKLNGLSQTFANASTISRIFVNALAGNDNILMAQSVNRPTSLNGGDGNDTIYGGTGTDIINGGAGTDTAFKSGTDTTSLVEEILS